mmetsp:Transcript_45670/g.40907  ORF Transcript_45670/g.40907 Transcript_45670/m.40907 type:complete len:192 (+) Transcript_45670:57-632(+)
MSSARKFKAKQLRELRKKSKKDLLTQCDELKKELHQLRVAQVSGGAPAKVANIRTTRKNIARIYTIISQITKQKVREEYKRQKKTLLPLDLRQKLTRRERLRLPNEYRFKKTPKQRSLINKYPRRKFAVIDSSNYLSKNVRELNIKNVLSEKKSSNRYYQYLRKKQNASKSMKKKNKQYLRKKINKNKNEE